jgi:hypothetical protein
MAKEQDQAEKTTEEKTVDTTETKDTSLEKAVDASKDFDKLLDDSDGVEETPPEDTPAKDDKAKAPVKSKAKDSKTKDDSKADDKDSGKEEDEDEEKTDDKAGDKAGEESPFSEGLTTRATDIGLTEEEIAQFEDEADLEAMVKKIEDIVGEADEQEPGSQTPTPPDKKKEDNAGDDSIVKFKDEAEIDPEILANMKAIEKKYNDEVQALRQEVAEMKSGVQKQQQAQFTKRFDGMVDKLGLEFVDVFGRGSLNDLGKRSQAFKNRDAVRARMYAFAKGLADSGQDLPDEQTLFDLAVNTLHGKKLSAVKSLRTKTKTDARSKQRIGRAAAGKDKPLKGDDAAVQVSKDFDALIDSAED